MSYFKAKIHKIRFRPLSALCRRSVEANKLRGRRYVFARVQKTNFIGLYMYSWLWQLIAHARLAYQF